MVNCEFEDDNKANLRHVTVDTIVLKDSKILLVKRNGKLIEGGKWAFPGGYVDMNETLPEAATREVYEETGWTIKDIRLLTVLAEPARPKDDRQNVTFLFFADAVEKTGEPDWESDEVRWFDIDNIPLALMAFDHADNLELYKKYILENLQLPIMTGM